jgi:hypothetical protein
LITNWYKNMKRFHSNSVSENVQTRCFGFDFGCHFFG